MFVCLFVYDFVYQQDYGKTVTTVVVKFSQRSADSADVMLGLCLYIFWPNWPNIHITRPKSHEGLVTLSNTVNRGEDFLLYTACFYPVTTGGRVCFWARQDRCSVVSWLGRFVVQNCPMYFKPDTSKLVSMWTVETASQRQINCPLRGRGQGHVT